MAHVRLHQHRLKQNPLYQEMLEDRRRAAIAEAKARRWNFVFCLISFLLWIVVTVVLTGWGMMTMQVQYSRVAIESGVLLGGAGIICTLLFAREKLG